jgi:ketosteroid isomerase-like protein
MAEASAEAKARREVTAAYAAYLKAFNANDMDAINNLVHYPLAYVADRETRKLWNFPYDPAELKSSKGWHTTTDADFEVVAVSDTKAHVILRNARRLRQDGSLIETVSAFYAFMKTGEGEWQMFAASAVTNPA